jgi:hypothetical protein
VHVQHWGDRGHPPYGSVAGGEQIGCGNGPGRLRKEVDVLDAIVLSGHRRQFAVVVQGRRSVERVAAGTTGDHGEAGVHQCRRHGLADRIGGHGELVLVLAVEEHHDSADQDAILGDRQCRLSVHLDA